MAASSEEFRTLKVAELVWRGHRLEVPLGSILLSQPRHMLAEASPVSVDSTKARKQPVPCKEKTYDAAGASSTSDISTLTEESCEAQSDYALLMLAGLSVKKGEGPILDPARKAASVNPFIGTDAPESLWGGVSAGGSDLMAHTVSVVSLDRCDDALRRELTHMHAKTRDRHAVSEALSELQPEESAASAVAIYAALDGAKVVMRALKKIKREGRAATRHSRSISVVLYSPVDEEVLISKADAFLLALQINRVAQNTETVSAIELVKAGSLVLNRTFEGVYRQQRNDAEPEILRKSMGVTGKTSRRLPLSRQLESPLLSRRREATFSQTLSFDIVRRVFENMGTASSATSSHVFVEAAISGRHLLDIDMGGGNPTASEQFWARPSSGGEVDPVYEDRLQFLSGFKMACSRAQNNIVSAYADEGNRIPEMSFSETQWSSQELVDKAINDLFAVDGGASDPALGSEHVGGSSLTRTEASNILTLTAVLMPKPASQAIWAFGHRFHPAAAKIAFHHETLLGSASRQLRGIAKRTAKDFQSFVYLSVVLSLAREVLSTDDEGDVTFRKAWSTKAFRLSSSFCDLFEKLDGLFKDGSLVHQIEKKQFNDMVGRLVEIVQVTQALEKELGRTLSTQPAAVSDMASAAGASESRPRPVELQSSIPAIDAVWECLWKEVKLQKTVYGGSVTMLTMTFDTAVSKLRALPEITPPTPASNHLEALPSGHSAANDPDSKPSQGKEKPSQGEEETHGAAMGGEKIDEEPVPEVDATKLPVPAPIPAHPVRSDYGLRRTTKEKGNQTYSGSVGRGWRRRSAIKKRKAKGPRLVVQRRKLGKALYDSRPSPPVQPSEKPSVGLSISSDPGKEGKLGYEMGDKARGLLRKGSAEAIAMLGTFGSVVMESIPGRDRFDEEEKEGEHNSPGEYISEVLQKRATLFSSLALAACHAVMQPGNSVPASRDAIVEGTFTAWGCCEKWAETFGEGETPTIRIKLRKNGPFPGVYATGGKADKEEGWVKLLEPAISSPLGLEQTDAVVFTHTDAYEAICPHHCSAASFLTEYLGAFLCPDGRWESTDASGGARMCSSMQRPRLRIVLPRKVLAAPPHWSIYEALFPCEQYSFRSLHDLQDCPPGVGLLVCPPEERRASKAQDVELFKVYWNIFGRWPTNSGTIPRTAGLDSKVGEQLATNRPEVDLADYEFDPMPVSLVGSLSTWNLIHALARGRQFSPGKFHNTLLGITSSDSDSVQGNKDPAQAVMDVLQFSVDERATVRRFLELQGGSSVEEGGMLSLAPGEIGIVNCKIPDKPLRDESANGPLSKTGSEGENLTGKTDLASANFEYLRPTFVTTL